VGTEATQSVETHVPIGTFSSLRAFQPDVIISVELGARTSFAALYAHIHNIPLVIWSYQSRSWAATAGPVLSMWRKALLSRADAVVGMGTQAREVLNSLDVSNARIFDAPNAHDGSRLSDGISRLGTESARSTLREKFSCRERVALVAGRLVAAKGILPLLAAWKRLDAEVRSEWTLLFVGDGPLAYEVGDAASEAPPGEIVCVGAVASDAMPTFYAGADLLVFPSLGDPWGLVVNESLASGVPALCSKLAGCADDLIASGRNGWTFDPTDADEFERALSQALMHGDLTKLGDRARESIAPFTPEAMAAGLRRAVTAAVRVSA
jgi:glycosyltransferase involved in cell wall biosynthesis